MRSNEMNTTFYNPRWDKYSVAGNFVIIEFQMSLVTDSYFGQLQLLCSSS